MSRKKNVSKKNVNSSVQVEHGMGGWGKAAVVGAGVIVGGGLLYFLKSGAGSEKDSPLTPQFIEDPLDAIVDALNRRFGKRWADTALSVLEKALEVALPPKVVSLVKVVHRAEILAIDGKIAAAEKKHWAETRIDEQRRNRLH